MTRNADVLGNRKQRCIVENFPFYILTIIPGDTISLVRPVWKQCESKPDGTLLTEVDCKSRVLLVYKFCIERENTPIHICWVDGGTSVELASSSEEMLMLIFLLCPYSTKTAILSLCIYGEGKTEQATSVVVTTTTSLTRPRRSQSTASIVLSTV